MISKSSKNMAILDESELKFTQNMNEMPKNLSLEKSRSNCQNHSLATQLPSAQENILHSKDNLNENFQNKIGDENKTERKSKEFPSETRIQLSFSVDRLLNNKLQQQHSPDHDSLGAKLPDKCCDDMNPGYSCCSLPNCLVNSASLAACKNLSFQGNTYPTDGDEDRTTTTATGAASQFMDFKSIVRPTPVRAMGNTSESVPTLAHFSILPTTSLIRFHHAHIQQQKQLTQHIPAQSNFTLSSLINPLCGLKPLQMGIQNFNTTATNRFNAKVNFDIPIVRPNLTCMPTLRHPHLTPPNSNESHINFNTTTSTTTTSTSSTAAVNTTNSATAHGNLNNGKRKRSWSRAVFSNLQRKGLEIQFQQQKYITKPDRRKLAARLNLTDAQVKVWFQNRRMKWRHTRENLKSGQEKQTAENPSTELLKSNADNTQASDLPGYSSDGSSSIEISEVEEDDDDEIDVVE
ncbi:hypothetical protein DOY81_002590 [Sarcophaga bullata]|nr:hypothetical protein DOY81_002590 [Sarcophaga bullata]